NRMIMHNRIISRLWVQRRGAKRVRPDLVLHRLDTRAGRIGHGNRTPNSQDRRSDDIVAIVPVRARDITGQREAWQAGDGYVRGTSDAKLVHPAAPDRDASCVTVVMNPLRLEQAAQPADLDVNDPAGAQVKRLAGVFGRVDALV